MYVWTMVQYKHDHIVFQWLEDALRSEKYYTIVKVIKISKNHVLSQLSSQSSAFL